MLAQQAQICSQLWKYTPAAQKLTVLKIPHFFAPFPAILNNFPTGLLRVAPNG